MNTTLINVALIMAILSFAVSIVLPILSYRIDKSRRNIDNQIEELENQRLAQEAKELEKSFKN